MGIKRIDPQQGDVKQQLEQQAGVKLNNTPMPNAEALERARQAARENRAQKQATKDLQQANFLHDPSVAMAAQASEFHDIQMRDGRVIVVGPPKAPFMMIGMQIFKGMQIDDPRDGAVMAQNARIMQYVRSINGKPLPDNLKSWPEVQSLMYELGELGCRAVCDAFDLYWPEGGSTYWTEIKKIYHDADFQMVMRVLQRAQGAIGWSECWAMTRQMRHAILLLYDGDAGAKIDFEKGKVDCQR